LVLEAKGDKGGNREKLTQRRKGAKAKTHANVAQSTRTSGEVIILKQRVFLVARLFSLANPVHRFEIENVPPCMVLTFAPLRDFFCT
jgi:hypothetical protein